MNFFCFLKSNAVEYFHNAHKKANFLKFTLVGLFHGCFAGVLLSFEYNFSKILRFPALVSRVLWQPAISLLLRFN